PALLVIKGFLLSSPPLSLAFSVIYLNVFLLQLLLSSCLPHRHARVKTFLLSPQTSPLFNKRIRSCAVVGNGGILLNSCCGSEIDKADYVFRFNLAPLNYSNDTGTKTNLITANPSILIERYSSLDVRRKPFMDLAKTFEPSLILMPAFSFPSNTVVSFKAYYTLEDFGSQQKVVYFHPNYLDNLAVYWKKKGLAVRRLSSGLMIVSTALEICNKVTLYGFWPFAQDFNGKPIPNHYYNKNPPNRYMHSMPSEFFLYSQMHSKGILKLKVGRCF
uniref:ST8 alpha-N-acetyl-neuraminide alpha-2,8-sialyltransferase 6 n=1 Tax=Leptobrachium leishanense TaxID=445787 RepID=A0A8C5M5S5_9ANUR